jgi:hypothetical protein
VTAGDKTGTLVAAFIVQRDEEDRITALHPLPEINPHLTIGPLVDLLTVKQ